MTPGVRWAIAGGAALLGGALSVLELDDPAFSVARLGLIVAVGLVMVGAGLVASANGEDRIGALVVLAGAAWLLERLLQAIPNGVAVTVGCLLTGLWAAFLAHAVVSFPSGRLAPRLEGVVVASGYVVNVGLTGLYLLALPSFALEDIPERNVLALFPNADAARWIVRSADVLTIAWAAVLVGLIVAKARAASPAARRAYGFVWVAGTVLYVSGIVIVSAGLEIFAFRDAYGLWLEIVAGLTPIALAASLFATRLAEDRLVALVADLETAGPGVTLRNALRRALADPALDVVYRRSGSEGWIDEAGQPMATAGWMAGRAVTPIERGGEPIAALIHDPALLRNPERLRAAGGAASLAIDNERLRVELRSQLLDVQASRSRIVEAADRERRRVERNLHDGAQQRLVGVALTLRLAGRRADGDPAVAGLLAEAAGELDDALEELRELARGIHPAIVTDAGLGGALETLAERPGVPVDLSVDLPGRLPDNVEVGAYYLVAEALANANKHAEAAHVSIRATVVDDVLRVGVSDDGRGGATPAPGSGLEGLADRVSALGGQLVIDSPPGSGTRISAELPLRLRPAHDLQRKPLTALKWLGWENWEVPGDAFEQLVEEDNLTYVEAMFACAGGSGRLTRREREWVIGYRSAAGDAEWVLDAIRVHDGAEPIEDAMRLPSMTMAGRAILYDTLRMCSSDGPLTCDELDRIRRAADRMGVPRDVIADLYRIVLEEHALRHRRHELVLAPGLALGSVMALAPEPSE